MDAPALIAALQEDVPGASLEAAATADLHTTIYVSPEHLPAIARALRDRADLRCVFLAELTAVDLHPREPRFELVYQLLSLTYMHRLCVKVPVEESKPEADSVRSIWDSAWFMNVSMTWRSSAALTPAPFSVKSCSTFCNTASSPLPATSALRTALT